jgi:ribosomal protein S18 acetylase RimI-like enzyme
MNIQRDERPNAVFSSSGSSDPLFLRAKFFADPFQADDATATGVAGSTAHFGRFAFKALPVFERGGLWISAHLGAADRSFAEAWGIYASSFSDCEQRAYFEQVALLRHPRYRFSALGHGDGVVGVLGWWDLPGFRFIEHIAISPAHRSSGFGGRAVSLMQQHLGGVIALDVEPPAAGADAVRRVAFYERHGFRFDAEPVTLPAYAGKRTAPSHLMTWSRAPGAPERDELLAAIRSEIYGLDIRAPQSVAV